ncbi:MAG: hypothetical protein WBF83_05500 [Moheibacter sp.]
MENKTKTESNPEGVEPSIAMCNRLLTVEPLRGSAQNCHLFLQINYTPSADSKNQQVIGSKFSNNHSIQYKKKQQYPLFV